jgi:hypothetical protein
MPYRVAMIRRLLLGLLAAFPIAGCKSTMPEQSGFLTGYDRLESDSSVTLESPPDERLTHYRSFVVDPVALRLDEKSNASPEKAEQLAAELQAAVEKALADAERAPDASGTARVRMALTRIRRSSPLLNLHPGTKLTGAGLGEAGIEAEILDAGTGEQLWALAAVRKGDRMELDAFNEYDDAEDAIEYWAGLIHDLFAPGK